MIGIRAHDRPVKNNTVINVLKFKLAICGARGRGGVGLRPAT
jgi:hypothetical protein